MKYYKIEQLLNATAPFGRGRNSNAKMNRALRRAESKKKKIAQRDVTEVSHDSLCQAIRELTHCTDDLLKAIVANFKKLGYKTITRKEITSYVAWDKHWDESSEFKGYVPEQFSSWQSIKSEFYTSMKYGHENPLPMNIKKDNNIIDVLVYGFRVPEPPPVTFLGTDAATRGRIVFCKIMSTNQFVAIAW